MLDEDDTVSLGSRSICQAKHSLEVWDRFGIAERMVEKGITWEQGEVYLRDQAIYRFNLQPEPGHKFPAFVNLQQYYVEEFLYERCLAEPLIEMRFRNKVVGVAPRADGVTRRRSRRRTAATTLEADWLVACDGVRSPGAPHARPAVRGRGLPRPVPDRRHPPARTTCPRSGASGSTRRSIRPTRCCCTARPTTCCASTSSSAATPIAEEEKKPENIDRRLRQMFGPEARWEHEWTSVYTFTCRMMQRFVHGRVIFAGDAAHVVSPFGARGGNGAIADVDNLAWKLALVVAGKAPAALLDSYCSERRAAARENILNSTRSTDFITPKFAASRAFRDATLTLAPDFPFARALINSGRLSVPTAAAGLAARHARPRRRLGRRSGAGAGDARCAGRQRLADRPAGPRLQPADVRRATMSAPCRPARPPCAVAGNGLAWQRYDSRPGTTYLIRPDRYVAARWRTYDPAAVSAALDARPDTGRSHA